MTCRFQQLFLLVDEIVHDGVLPMLTWKDLSQMDLALNARAARFHFYRWCHRLVKDYTINSQQPSSFLDWVQSRGIRFACVRIGSGASDVILKTLTTRNIAVYGCLYNYNCGATISMKVLSDFVMSLQSIRSFFMCSSREVGSISMWRAFIRKHPDLHTFQILAWCTISSAIAQDIVETVANCSKSLAELSLGQVGNMDDGVIERLARGCNQLKVLRMHITGTLSDRSLLALGRHCTQLKVLHLENASGYVTDTGVVYLLQRCPRLTSLQLWDCAKLTSSSITALTPFCHQLTELHLHKCKALDSDVADAVLRKMDNLVQLNLSGCVGLRQSLLSAILHNNPKLRSIDLSSVRTITDSVLATIAQVCLDLIILRIDYCTEVTNISVLGSCSRLFALYISGCTGVSDETLLELAATVGESIYLVADGSGVTMRAKELLQKSKRISLCL